MNFGGCLVVGVMCLAGTVRADTLTFEGRLALGLRTSSSSGQHEQLVFDDTSTLRAAADGSIGVRIDRLFVGLHAGLAAPLHFEAIELADSGEIVPLAVSTIYPADLGVAGEVDIGRGIWASAWIGVTVAFTHATSAAIFLNNISASGQVPAVSWRYRTASLGYGGAFGYDFLRTQRGRFAGLIELDSQGVGAIPIREDTGYVTKELHAVTATSFTFGVAYRY